jgi:ribosomal protein S18 acetylase RimI-like enzyme
MDECLSANNLFPNKTLHVMLFAVDPRFRSRGIGGMLFEIMYKQNDFQNATHYILAMREHNEIAKKFYLKQGFIESGFKCEAMYENPIDDQIMLIKKV